MKFIIGVILISLLWGCQHKETGVYDVEYYEKSPGESSRHHREFLVHRINWLKPYDYIVKPTSDTDLFEVYDLKNKWRLITPIQALEEAVFDKEWIKENNGRYANLLIVLDSFSEIESRNDHGFSNLRNWCRTAYFYGFYVEADLTKDLLPKNWPLISAEDKIFKGIDYVRKNL